MPAFRRYNPSVAPVPIIGTTTTPGHMVFVTDSIAPITSGVNGDAALGFASSTKATVIFGSANTFVSVSLIAAGGSPGRMRQLTFAVAVCGSAFGACPPLSIVGTHVVRISALTYG